MNFWKTLSLFFLIALTSCSDESQDLRGNRSCNIYNNTGSQCERADFSLEEPAESFEALARQTFTWQTIEGAESFEIAFSENDDCSEPVQEFDGLAETEIEVVIESPGEYFVCLTMIDIEEDRYEALNSRHPITVLDSTIAILSFGKTDIVNFGTIVVEQEVFASIPVQNFGVSAATNLAITNIAEPFRFKGENKVPGTFPGLEGDCNLDVDPENLCSLYIAFKPPLKGSFEQKIELSYENGTEEVTIPLTLKGAAEKAGILDFSDSEDFTYANTATGTSLDATFTLTNNGYDEVTQITPSTVSAPFVYKDGTFPGGGTCGETLLPGISCTFVLTFSPTAVGSSILKLTIIYSNGAGSQNVGKTISATGISP